ncbi:MAG: exodeoxyribonuclease VII small subunit [Gemmatimonadota bacterium]
MTDRIPDLNVVDEQPRGFEELMAELDAIVRELDRGDVQLDDALALFETGVSRLREAGRMLDYARGRVEELIESAAGDLSVIGFNEDSGPADETAQE